MSIYSPWLLDKEILLAQEALFTHPLVTKKFRPKGDNKAFKSKGVLTYYLWHIILKK